MCPHSLFQCLYLMAKRDSKEKQWIQGRYKPAMLTYIMRFVRNQKMTTNHFTPSSPLGVDPVRFACHYLPVLLMNPW